MHGAVFRFCSPEDQGTARSVGLQGLFLSLMLLFSLFTAQLYPYLLRNPIMFSGVYSQERLVALETNPISHTGHAVCAACYDGGV